MSDASSSCPPLSPAHKAWRFLGLLLRPAVARKLGTLVTDGYLADSGWIRSVAQGKVVDVNGSPLPWATLPFIDFIAPRLRASWTVFEYGAGASTNFYAQRVRTVISVEHNEQFAKELRPSLSSNTDVRVRPNASAAYSAAVMECPVRPALVSVDGEDRNQCVQAALTGLANDGVLVLDDSERPEYQTAHLMLADAGFRAVEFWGVAPGMVMRKCTTVFYRRDNVLGL